MRFGVIGSNFIVERFLQAAKLDPDFVLQAVYSRSIEKAEQNAAKWGANRACASLDALAAMPDVDAVYIASPNALHYAQAKQMLLAGKHVLCEKPIVPSASELEALLTIAREKGVCLLEAMRPAFLPCVPLIGEQLARIAPLRHADLPYCQYSSRYDKFKQGIIENAFDPTLCNGALMDIGVYGLSWLERLFGTPESIQAQAVFLPGSIDASGTVLCRYTGFAAVVSYSKVHDGARPCVIEGENGTLTLSPFPIPRVMTFKPRKGEVQTFDLAMQEQDMLYELQAFQRFCADPLQATAAQRHALSTLRLMDEIRTQTGIDFTRHQ